ncbi:MAG: class I SAM-dependent methyltransferase [Planctomycetota bacterium]|jgi:hypothetical protein
MKDKLGLSTKSVGAGDYGYISYHAPRYAFLLRLLAGYGLTSSSTVLDIGPSRFTSLIREHFGVAVDSLGFGPDRLEDGDRHFGFDLNLTQDKGRWRQDLPTYEFVLMTEVIEHLYTAPELVLAFVKTLLVDDGLLILQTPNAVSLPKRVKLLLGCNPYEMIRVDPSNPGHFREYTISELGRLAENLEFRVERCTTAYYYDAKFARHEEGYFEKQSVVGSIKNFLYRCLTKGLREGITMVWRKRGVA